MATIGRVTALALFGGGLVASTACGLDVVGTLSCQLGNVDVTGNATAHRYSYTFDCTDGFKGKVSGGWEVGTGRTQEKADTNKGKGQATWTCPADPWSTEGANLPVCTRGNVSMSNENGPFPVGYDPHAPYTAVALTAQQRHVMNAQLQNALKQQPSTGSAPGGSVGPAKPQVPPADLVAASVTGATNPAAFSATSYTVVARNAGGKDATNVVVTIAGDGTLTPQAVTGVPAGFTCSGGGGAAITCTGTLTGSSGAAAQRSATFLVRTGAGARGAGGLTLSVNPSHAIPESDYTNNVQRLAVFAQ